MTELRYVVEGRPVSWQRLTMQGGRHVMTAAQRSVKASHALCARAALGRAQWPLEGVFEVEMVVRYPNAVQGDVDRLAGLPLDALEGVAYKADRQVKRLVVDVGIDRERPRTEVTIRRRAE